MMLPELPSRFIKIALGFIALVFVANVLLLDFFFVQQRGSFLDFQTRLTQLADSFKILGGRLYTSSGGEVNPNQKPGDGPSILNPVNNSICPTSCVDLISLSATAGSRVSTKSLIAPYVPTTTTNTTASSKGEYFVPMGSGSVNQTSDWTNIDSAQASFDAGNYSFIKAAYFEVFLRRSTSASGDVYARLFDATTPAILWGSEATTNSTSSTFISKQITLSSGQKTYKVQMYSTNGVSYLDQARIRIVTQ